MAVNGSLTTSQVLAAATELLMNGGYESVPLEDGGFTSARVFEDPYGIVAVNVFDTWESLSDGWHLAQGSLVDLISNHLTRPEPKSWEGYLVLLTPAPVPEPERSHVADLRYDTNRLRKLVATGEDLQTLDDVREALLPLLPLEVEPPGVTRSGLLDRLPNLLASEGIPAEITRAVVEAFVDNGSIMERLHAERQEL